MDSNSRFNREQQRVTALKRIVTAVVVLLILASIALAALLIIGTFGEDSPASREGAEPRPQLEQQESVEQILENAAEPKPEPATSEAEPVTSEAEPVTSEAEPAPSEQQDAPDLQDEPDPEVEAGDQGSAAQQDEGTEAVSFTEYEVKSGDTLRSIAESFSLRPETIISVNEIENINQLQAGRVLNIPDRDGQIYTVKEGDSLSVIAHNFDMGYVTLAEVNGLSSSLIRIGQRLFIPERTISAESFQRVMNTLFIRPAEGRIVVDFSDKVEDILTGELYSLDGVRIENSVGTPVKAAMAGRVTEVENRPSGLGRYVIMSHDGGYTTTYGHLDSASVSPGQNVEQGEQIGRLGSTGRILEPVLYFSVKKDGQPVDPAEFF
jgi:murein DD-endopeptidase MepM/ murein hydrolase activator NlpD